MAIESANVVGYQTSSARSGFNFYTPVFRNIGTDVDANGNKIMDIQDIQMGSEVGAMGANLQLRGANGVSTAYYVWFDAGTAGAFGINDGTKGAWVNEDMSPISPAVTIVEGESVQIDATEGDGMMSSGQVSDDDITYLTRSGFNFVGNAFPGALDIQMIQMDSTVGAMGANLQIRGANGVSTAYYVWFDAATAGAFGMTDGSVGAWVNEDMSAISPAVVLQPGEAVQVDIADANKTVTVLAPIEL